MSGFLKSHFKDFPLNPFFAWIRIRIKVRPGSESGSVTNFFTSWIWIRIKIIRIRHTELYCSLMCWNVYKLYVENSGENITSTHRLVHVTAFSVYTFEQLYYCIWSILFLTTYNSLGLVMIWLDPRKLFPDLKVLIRNFLFGTESVQSSYKMHILFSHSVFTTIFW